MLFTFEPAKAAGGQPLRLMSYNIRYDNPGDGDNRWDKRKTFVAGLIRFHQPDVLGVQEALLNQIKDLEVALPQYGWYGVGREDGKEKGEFSAIFYNKNRFDLLDKGTFWLSPTPDMPSKGWDAAIVRICSWIRLKDKRTGNTFYHFNTHFDHLGEKAREESAKLILTKIQSIAAKEAFTLTGDFNTPPTSAPYKIMTGSGQLWDAKTITGSPHYGPEGSWSTFDVATGIGERIDFIFVSDQFDVGQHAILTDSQQKHYPSDHLPVIADIEQD
jgi:endonuclease/exonuclease/phosphatase family metal-dependent hydrolase